MESDEVAKVDFYLGELRILRSMESKSLHLTTLEESMKTMKATIETLIRSKIKYSGELLDAGQAVNESREERDRLEQLVCKTMSLVEESQTKIATMADSIVALIASKEAESDQPMETAAEVLMANDQINAKKDGEHQVYRCDGCPKKFRKAALLHRHELRKHGEHSAAAPKSTQRKFKKKNAKKVLKVQEKRNVYAALKMIKVLAANRKAPFKVE